MKKIIIFSMIVLLLSVFLASAEVYVIKKPDALSKWARGSKKDITWDKKGDTYPDVKIRLYTSPGNVKVEEITNSTDNDEIFKWTIPASTAIGKYFIRVKTLNNAKWGDSKEFEIVKGNQLKPGVLKDALKKDGSQPTFKPSKGMFKPVIDGVLDVPLGALKPGSKLYLKGKRFGTKKGKIIVKGNFPGGQFELINVKWESSGKANGVVPQSVNGNPNQTVGVVLVTSYNAKSDPWNMGFKGREEKVLLNTDVQVVHCGDDGNFNVCNKNATGDSAICRPEYAICGYHRNKIAAIGDDSGADTYKISLKNGWTLKSMHKSKWHKSSSDETLNGPSPGFPAGQSSWQPTITWVVSPNDTVWYRIKIIVEGPIGTHYK